MAAAEDSGTAIGAAYHGSGSSRNTTHSDQFCTTRPDALTACRDLRCCKRRPKTYHVVNSTDVISDAVDLLCDGKIIGWFDGGSELGPRRSDNAASSAIRASRRERHTQPRVKMREPFRPFAPAVLLEEASSWFDFDGTTPESPFMLRVVDVKPKRRTKCPRSYMSTAPGDYKR
jgi:carbamoyltransferase